MRRRDFMKMLGVAGAGAATTPLLSACGPGEGNDPTEERELIDWLAETGPELSPGFPTSLLAPAPTEDDLALAVISGKLPPDITGHVFVVAAIPWGDGTMIFNGNGIMYRLDLGVEGGARLLSKVARSPCYYADRATEGERNGFSNVGVTRISGLLGVRNELNTAFLPMGHRMFVTYDGGRPWEIDVNTLELITPLGWRREWKSSIPFVTGPFLPYLSTAHPFYDEHTDEVFTINYGGEYDGQEPFVNVMRWSGDALESWRLVDDQGRPVAIKQSVHQMAITEDYILVVDCAFLVEDEQIFNAEYSRAQEPDTIVYIVRRSALESGASDVLARSVTLARESVHLTADYENPGDKITLHIAHNSATDASEWLRESDTLYHTNEPVRSELVGFIPSATDINFVGHHVIDGESAEMVTSQVVVDEEMTWGVGFLTHLGQTPPGRLEHIFFNSVGFTDETLTKRVVELYAEYPHREVSIEQLTVSKLGTLFHFDPVALDITDAYVFPPGRFGSSPQFVPRQNAKDGADGYLVCTVVSDDASWEGSSGDEFWIFDARDLQKGPITRLGNTKLDLGFTLHTAFLPELKPRGSDYKVSVREDYSDGIEERPEDVRALLEDEVFPHFD